MTISPYSAFLYLGFWSLSGLFLSKLSLSTYAGSIPFASSPLTISRIRCPTLIATSSSGVYLPVLSDSISLSMIVTTGLPPAFKLVSG